MHICILKDASLQPPEVTCTGTVHVLTAVFYDVLHNNTVSKLRSLCGTRRCQNRLSCHQAKWLALSSLASRLVSRALRLAVPRHTQHDLSSGQFIAVNQREPGLLYRQQLSYHLPSGPSMSSWHSYHAMRAAAGTSSCCFDRCSCRLAILASMPIAAGMTVAADQVGLCLGRLVSCWCTCSSSQLSPKDPAAGLLLQLATR